jgi:hypothetical protein
MIRILIAFDELDPDMGAYFTACKEEILLHTEDNSTINVDCINGRINNYNVVTDHITTFDEKPFIFISYAHGREDAILLNSDPVIDLENAYYFGTSLFYSCSCRVAQQLGKQLVEVENCKAFIGYREDAMLASVEKYDDIFRACDNFGIKHFLNGNTTLKTAFEAMIDFYTEQLDLLSLENAMAASYLLDSRNALTLLPSDSNCTLNDFYAE